MLCWALTGRAAAGSSRAPLWAPAAIFLVCCRRCRRRCTTPPPSPIRGRATARPPPATCRGRCGACRFRRRSGSTSLRPAQAPSPPFSRACVHPVARTSSRCCRRSTGRARGLLGSSLPPASRWPNARSSPGRAAEVPSHCAGDTRPCQRHRALRCLPALEPAAGARRAAAPRGRGPPRTGACSRGTDLAAGTASRFEGRGWRRRATARRSAGHSAPRSRQTQPGRAASCSSQRFPPRFASAAERGPGRRRAG
mmetsp:Transcript_3799/g.11187  ORF Transcript_3799/g.11187 Transcript_3799/m.11187 type:complete len:253 (+) Transcript_3799:375-1133(+)